MKKYAIIKHTIYSVVKTCTLKKLKDFEIMAQSDNKPALLNLKKIMKR